MQLTGPCFVSPQPQGQVIPHGSAASHRFVFSFFLHSPGLQFQRMGWWQQLEMTHKVYFNSLLSTYALLPLLFPVMLCEI